MRPTWAEIDLSALEHNFGKVKNIVESDVQILSVVKADAYGHGAVRVGTTLVECGTDMLGVATLEEALELRRAQIAVPIVLLGGVRTEEIPFVIENNLTPCVFSLEIASELDRAAISAGRKAKYHLKIDTGMTRLGVRSEEFKSFFSELRTLNNIHMEGVLTHLASAYTEDKQYTRTQLETFQNVIEMLKESGFDPEYMHTANSASIRRYPNSHMNLVRPGIMLYGADGAEREGFKPVMKLKSRIIQLVNVPAGTPVSYGGTFVTKRSSIIATLPIGYADGYMRKLSNRAFVSIKDKKAPVLGTVCMDLTMIDVTDVHGIKVGDEVVLFGDGIVTADDVSAWADTISYEILSITGKRVPRNYI